MISFPATPVDNQIFRTDTSTFIWNALTEKWNIKQDTPAFNHKLIPDSAEVDLDFSQASSFEINSTEQKTDGIDISFSNPPDTSGKFTIKLKNDQDLVKRRFEYTGNSHNVLYGDTQDSASSMLDVGFKPDGTKMYMFDDGTNRLYEYDLTISWDIQSRVYNDVSFSVGATANSGTYGFGFSHDGTKMFAASYNTHILYQFDMTTAWDVATMSYSGISVDLDTVLGINQSGNLYTGVTFNINDEAPGTKMFFVSYETMYEVEMITPYDIANAVYADNKIQMRTLITPSRPVNQTDFRGLSFNNDGTKIYISDIYGAYDHIHQVTLNAPYSLASGNFVYDGAFEFDTLVSVGNPLGIYVKADGSKFWILGSGSKLFELEFTTTDDMISTIPKYSNISLQYYDIFRYMRDGFFNNDGTKLYFAPNSNNTFVMQYKLLIPYDIRTLQYDNKRFNTSVDQSGTDSMYMTPDASRIFITSSSIDTVVEYIMNTPGDVTTMAFLRSFPMSVTFGILDLISIYFSNDGTKLYGTLLSGSMYYYTLSTPWDITTISYNASYSATTLVDSRYANARCMRFSARGDIMYFLDTTDNCIYFTTLSIPWDPGSQVSTGVALNFNSQTTTELGFAISRSSDKIYIMASLDNIYEYQAPVLNELNSYPTQSKLTYLANGSKEGLQFSSDGTKLFFIYGGSYLYGYTLSTPWDVGTAVLSYSTTIWSGFGIQNSTYKAMQFSPDGKKLFITPHTVGNPLVYQINLATGWDLTSFVSPALASPVLTGHVYTYSMYLDPIDGTKLYFVGGPSATAGVLYRYDLTTGWDITTTPATATASLNLSEGATRSIQWSPDGTTLYTNNYTSTYGRIRKYIFTTPWDINSTVSNIVYTDTSDIYMENFYIKDDYTTMYISYTTSISSPIKTYIIAEPYIITWPENLSWGDSPAPSFPKLDNAKVFDIYTSDGGTTYTGIEKNSAAYNSLTLE